MSPYRYAITAGTAVFLAQLVIVAQPQLDALNQKSGELAVKALTDGASLPIFAALGYYLVAGLACHVLPLLLVAKIHSDMLEKGSPRLRNMLGQRGAFTLSLLGALAAMVIANAAYFPQSSAFPNQPIETAAKELPWLLPLVGLTLASVLLYWLAKHAGRKSRSAAAVFALLGVVAWTVPEAQHVGMSVERAQPDIIVIGVDSLRPDHLPLYGFPGPSLTPSIDRFVSGAVRYDRAFTPQGRTFIAYMSILTGQYPVNHGARENLYPVEHIHKEASIAQLLRNQGYQTVFALDEARFANFDQGYGFDDNVSPPPGLLDFAAGSFFDTVGSNLLQLAPYSDIILPHVAGNRAASTTYRPEVHSRRLARELGAQEQDRPLFLAAHFCMAHVPFAPADHLLPVRAPPFEDSPISYQTALRVADTQVGALLETLKQQGRLNNAIVVLLSDHGEALGMHKDQWKQANGRVAPPYYGHGMPALDVSQSRVLLAVQRFRKGLPTLPPGSSQAPVSLVDVAPTVLALANLSATQNFDGIALFTPSGKQVEPQPGRPIFIESGFSGLSLQNADVDNGDVVNEFSHLYEVTEDHRFELAEEALPRLLEAKQRAVVIDGIGISTVPAGQMRTNACWLRVDLATNEVECFPQDSDVPALASEKALVCEHFSSDTTFYTEWCLAGAVSTRFSKY